MNTPEALRLLRRCTKCDDQPLTALLHRELFVTTDMELGEFGVRWGEEHKYVKEEYFVCGICGESLTPRQAEAITWLECGGKD